MSQPVKKVKKLHHGYHHLIWRKNYYLLTAVFLKTGKPISLLVSQFFDVGPRGQRGFPTGVVLRSTIVPVFNHFLLIGHGPGLKKGKKKCKFDLSWIDFAVRNSNRGHSEKDFPVSSHWYVDLWFASMVSRASVLSLRLVPLFTRLICNNQKRCFFKISCYAGMPFRVVSKQCPTIEHLISHIIWHLKYVVAVH